MIFNMSSKRASVKPLALFLKPQSPAERLAARQRDHEKLQEEAKGKGEGPGCDEEARGAPVYAAPTSLLLFPHLRVPLCVTIAACKPLPHLSFPASEHCAAPATASASASATASASASATASASSTNSSSSAQAAFSGGLSNSKSIHDRALPKCPRTQKSIPDPLTN